MVVFLGGARRSWGGGGWGWIQSWSGGRVTWPLRPYPKQSSRGCGGNAESSPYVPGSCCGGKGIRLMEEDLAHIPN